MKDLKMLFAGGFAAIVLAVVLRILAPAPVTTTFAVLLFFLAIQIAEAKFGAGARLAISWVRWTLLFLARAGVMLVAFFTLRFLIAQVFHLYPVDPYSDWVNGGGFQDVFWGHQAPTSIAHEIVILGLLGWILWGWASRSSS